MWDDHYKIVVPLRPYQNYALFLMVYNNEVWIGILLSVLVFMPCMILADKVFFGSTNWEANMGFVLSLICSDVTCKVPGTQEGDSIGKTFDLSFGMKNGLRVHFGSATRLNYPFLNIFLVYGNIKPKFKWFFKTKFSY